MKNGEKSRMVCPGNRLQAVAARERITERGQLVFVIIASRAGTSSSTSFMTYSDFGN